MTAIERITDALHEHGSKGTGTASQCPAHKDRTASLSVTNGDGRVLVHCHAGCHLDDVLAALALASRDLFDDADNSANGEIIATYDYTDEAGALLFQVVRKAPKKFLQRRPDATSSDGWAWSVKDVRKVLYRLPAVIEAVAGGRRVWIVEGEKDVHAIEHAGEVATCNPGGAGKWRDEYAVVLSDAEVVVVADTDDPGRDHAKKVLAGLTGVAKTVRIVEAAAGKDASDHLGAGRGLDDLVEVGDGDEGDRVASPTTLPEVIQGFRRWLYLPDLGALIAALGAVAANRLPGDPVWLLIVAPSGWGKTEVLGPLAGLPDVHPAATLTEAALLSGTPARDKGKGAKGGLLNEIGAFGIVLCKDFGSVLNMHRDGRASVLAALREVYDGSWTRHVGTDGGRTLHWQGKVGLIAGCTPTIDSHQAVMAQMGERFCLYRLPKAEATDIGAAALRGMGREKQMRDELAALVRGLIPAELIGMPALSDAETERLVALAILATKGRSAVERDGYSREIELIPGEEAPGRLAKTLGMMLGGMAAIGVPRDVAWRIVTKMALDSIPALRLRVIGHLLELEGPRSTRSIAAELGYPTKTTARALEDLAAYGFVDRTKDGDHETAANRWSLGEAQIALMVRASGACPEKSHGECVALAQSLLLTPPTIEEDFSGQAPKPRMAAAFEAFRGFSDAPSDDDLDRWERAVRLEPS